MRGHLLGVLGGLLIGFGGDGLHSGQLGGRSINTRNFHLRIFQFSDFRHWRTSLRNLEKSGAQIKNLDHRRP